MRPPANRSYNGSSEKRNSGNTNSNSNRNSNQNKRKYYYNHHSKNNANHYPQAKRYNRKEKTKVEELYAYMVEPPEKGDSSNTTNEPKITRVLTLLPIHDVRLDRPKSYQPSVVITTTDGRMYRRNPRTNRVMEPSKKLGHYVFSIWKDHVTYGGYLDEEGCVHVQMRHMGTATTTTKGALHVWQKVGFERPRNYPPVKIVQLVLSGPTFVALSEGGNVFMWNEGTRVVHQRPNAVSALRDIHIVQIAASESLVAALTNDGIVYTWAGADIHHQDNNDNEWNNNELLYVPTRSDHVSSSIQQIGCSNHRLVALDQSGREIYCLPDGETSSDKGIIYRPLEKVCSISCGETSCLALSEDGRVFAWGSDFSIEDPDREHHLEFFDSLDPQKIECAGQCLLVLTRHKHSSHPSSNTSHGAGVLQENETSQNDHMLATGKHKAEVKSTAQTAHRFQDTYTATSSRRHSESSSPQSSAGSGPPGVDRNRADRPVPAVRQLIPLSEEDDSREERAAKKQSDGIDPNVPIGDLLLPDKPASNGDYWAEHQHQHDENAVMHQEDAPHFTSQAYHEKSSSAEANVPHGFTEVHGWLCGKWTALTAIDLQRYAMGLVHHGFNSVELLKEMLTPTQLAKCLQDSKGKSLSAQHIHFQYICKQLKKDGLEGFSS